MKVIFVARNGLAAYLMSSAVLRPAVCTDAPPAKPAALCPQVVSDVLTGRCTRSRSALTAAQKLLLKLFWRCAAYCSLTLQLVIDNPRKTQLRTIMFSNVVTRRLNVMDDNYFLSTHARLAWSEEEGMFVRDVRSHAIPSRSRLFDSWRGSFQASAP
jgi:hypothetical protein